MIEPHSTSIVQNDKEEIKMPLENRAKGNSPLETIKQKAQPYFERGYYAVIEKHTLRNFDEAADIIKSDLLEHGFSEWWSESLACVFARSYIAGIAAATCLEVSA